MMIIIQILCAYIPATALIMISANFDQKTINLAGSIDEVGTECAVILRQILQQNKQNWGNLGAQGVLVNIFMLALSGQTEKLGVNIKWKSKEDMVKKEEVNNNVDLSLVSQSREKAMKDGFFIDESGNKIQVQHFDVEQVKDDDIINKLSEIGDVNAISPEQIEKALKRGS